MKKEINEFTIKVETGYENNIFYKKNNKLDIIENMELLSMYPVTIELRKYKEERDGELIATIYGNYFDLDYMCNENIPLFEIFDGIDQATYDLYEVLFDEEDYKEEFEIFNPNLFYLTNIIVEEKYRKQGYAKMLINSLEEILLYVAKLNIGVIATELYGITYNENLSKEEKTKLNNKMKDLLIENDYYLAETNNNYLVKPIY